jgi:hypothetical protein
MCVFYIGYFKISENRKTKFPKGNKFLFLLIKFISNFKIESFNKLISDFLIVNKYSYDKDNYS